MYKTKYANAYAEVYEILSYLDKEEYNKIPKELIEVFEENRNLEYEYEVNEEQDLTNQPMLIETKAILLNIFRDYLATPEQSSKIKRWLYEDREYLDQQKRKKYPGNMFKDNSKKECNTHKEEVMLPTEIKKQSLIKKIFDKIKSIFENRGI
jgi:hypothetical protein